MADTRSSALVWLARLCGKLLPTGTAFDATAKTAFAQIVRAGMQATEKANRLDREKVAIDRSPTTAIKRSNSYSDRSTGQLNSPTSDGDHSCVWSDRLASRVAIRILGNWWITLMQFRDWKSRAKEHEGLGRVEHGSGGHPGRDARCGDGA